MADKTLVELTPTQHINRLIDETKINQYSTFKSALLGYFGYDQNSNISLLALVQEFTGSDKTDPQACFNDAYGSNILYEYTIREMLALGVGGLPQENLLFNSQKDAYSSVEYPTLDANYEPDFTTLTETKPELYNVYIVSEADAQTITRPYTATDGTEFSYYKVADGETTATEETGTISSNTISIDLDSGDKICLLYVGDDKINLDLSLRDNSFSGVDNCVNQYIPQEYSTTLPFVFPIEFTADGVDIYGCLIIDWSDINSEPPCAIITFPEIESYDIFDRTNALIWQSDNLAYDGFEEEIYPRRWKVSTLLRGNEFLSSLTIGAWKVFIRESGGGLKQIVAYIRTNNYFYVEEGNSETDKSNTFMTVYFDDSGIPSIDKVLKAMKDTISDDGDYRIYLNYKTSANLNDSDFPCDYGIDIKKIYSISSDLIASQDTLANRPTLTTNGYLFASSDGLNFSDVLTGQAIIDDEYIDLDDNNKITYTDLQDELSVDIFKTLKADASFFFVKEGTSATNKLNTFKTVYFVSE